MQFEQLILPIGDCSAAHAWYLIGEIVISGNNLHHLSQLPQKDVFSISLCHISEAQVALYRFDGKGLKVDAAVVKEIARRLQLSYIPETYASVAVCYLNSPEVRPEFKVSFTRLDLSDYLNGVLCSAVYQERLMDALYPELVFIPFAADSNEFWRLVEGGRALRQ